MIKYTLENSLKKLDKEYQEYSKESEISETTRGEIFERLVKFYFENDPAYKGKFNHVYDKNNIPEAIKERINQKHNNDIGIDLIAVDVFNKIYAIQIKRYKNTVSYQEVVTFLDQYHKNPNIDYGIIVSTAVKGPSTNLLTEITEDDHLTYIGLENLEQFNFSGYFDNFDNHDKNKELRGYQKEAVKSVVKGFETTNRGQLIMATGTGKTFTSIKIVEQLANKKDGEFRVLYVMPTLQLLKQTLENYWKDAPLGSDNFYSLAINSDSKTTKNKKEQLLGFPATTSAEMLANKYKDIAGHKKVLVFFSTYQSIQTVHDAQEKGLPTFDLIIADEAHKTVGTNAKDSKLKIYQQILPDDFIKSDKRLFQTATPKVFKQGVKVKAESRNIDIFVMSDEKVYGKEFYNYSLGQAIKDGYLTDYQIIVSAIWDDDERVIRLLKQMSNPKNDIEIGNLNSALDKLNKKRKSANTEKEANDLDKEIKQTENDRNKLEKKIGNLEADIGKFINLSKSVDSKGQKIISNLHGEIDNSKLMVSRLLGFSDTNAHSKKQVTIFKTIQSEYTKQVHADGSPQMILNAEAANGAMSVREKTKELADFATDYGENHVNFLNNVKFLTEGIDVPNLDAVVFLQPKESEVDIVQAVGRALRLDKNNPNKVAKIIIPALLRRNAQNELDLGNNKMNALDEAGFKTLREVIYNLRANDSRLEDKVDLAISMPIDMEQSDGEPIDVSLDIDTKFLQNVADSLQTSIVEEAQLADIHQFRRDIANYARVTRKNLKEYLDNLNENQQKIYDNFYKEMNSIIDISDTGIDFVDTITQHIALDPLLVAYFESYSTNEYANNSVRLSFEHFLNDIGFKRIESYQMTQLVNFIKRMVEGVRNPRKLQDILNSIYEVYFNADKDNNVDSSLKATIKPTPSPIVDYMVSSVDELLQDEFNTNLKSKNVGILEPFIGTGTFLVHTMMYLREKLKATNDEILYKFKNQLFGQELLLIAYYIASSNLQVELKSLTSYEEPYNNLVMGNTFMSLNPEKFTTMNFGYLDTNIKKLAKQYEAPIKVIMGNPPYLSQSMEPYRDIQSISLKLYKDDEVSKMVNLRNSSILSNSYIGAITYAIERLKQTKENIISYIFPHDWLRASTTIGLRKFILNNFKDVYIVDLKGSSYAKNDETQGKSVFDIQQGVAIVFFVSDKSYNDKAKIYYFSLDSMTKKEKLDWLRDNDLKGTKFKLLNPDGKYNYFPLNNNFEYLYDEKYKTLLDDDFEKGLGLASNRDSWVVNSSKNTLSNSIKKQINYYNSNVDDNKFINGKKKTDNFKYTDTNKPIKLVDNKINENIKIINYRPFVKKWIYAPDPSQKISKQFIERYRKFFRNWNNGELIFANSTKKIDLLVVNQISDYEFFKHSKTVNVSSLRNIENNDISLFYDNGRDNDYKIDAALMYAITYTPQYRKEFSNLVQDYYKYPTNIDKNTANKLIQIGQHLMKLHLNYDNPEAPRFEDSHVSFINKDNKNYDYYFHVEKIKFDINDSSKIIFNNNIIINDIPNEVYDFKLNGRTAIEHIMNEYCYKDNATTPKTIKSEVPDDPNKLDVSEYWKGGHYVFEILMRVIQLSVETVHIMEKLRKLQDETDFLMLKSKNK